MTRYRILEGALLAGIVLFVGLAVSRCTKPEDATFNAPENPQCQNVEWTGIAKGEITKNGFTELPAFAPNHCARILFSGPSTAQVWLESYQDGGGIDPSTWIQFAQITNPGKTPQGWGGMVDSQPLKIRARTTAASGTIHYALFQAKPKTP